MKRIIDTAVAILVLATSVNAQNPDIPDGVASAAREGLIQWLAVVKNMSESEIEWYQREIAADSDTCDLMPYAMFVISSTDLARCDSGSELISSLAFDCYRAPILYYGVLSGFVKIRMSLDEKTNTERWRPFGLGLNTERGENYYRLSNEIAENAELHPFMVIPWGYMFFVVKEEPDVYRIIPASEGDTRSLRLTCGYDDPRTQVTVEEFLACFRKQVIIGY